MTVIVTKCGAKTRAGTSCAQRVGWGTDHVGTGRCRLHGASAHPDDVSAIQYETVKRPQDWDKAVSAAYLWLVLEEKKAAAEGAGIGERTMHRWVHSEWWPEACAEAKGRWLNHLEAESRRTLMRAIVDGDADKALGVLQQLDPTFRPHAKRIEVVGLVAFVQGMPDDEVRRIKALPEADRPGEIQRLALESGLQLVD